MPTSDRSVTANSSTPPHSHGSEPATLNYAFLVHSQKTLTQNLPPRVDNKLLARQKRRRTSPEDHAILEAEYRKNPKPDKAARASIVGRVALGEKEVQIWFQNRRQNDRRKSKPLLSHELIGPRSTLHDPTAHSGSDDNVTAEPQSSNESDHTEEHERAIHDTAVGTSLEENVGAASGDSDRTDPTSQTNVGWDSSQTSQSQAEDASHVHSTQEVEKTEGPGAQPTTGRKRPFPNIREEGFHSQGRFSAGGRSCVNESRFPPSLRISMSFDGEAMVRKEGEVTPSPPKGRSAVRISLSSDGKALIRTEDEPSPSKNRIRLIPTRTPRLHGLRRSSSAISFGGSRLGLDGISKPFGRSRDPRAWELYCDTDARSALSTPSSSQSGPSAGTPGLYRSYSHRSFRNSLSKPNALTPRSDLLNQKAPVIESSEKRRKLSRTVSSLGRLETGHKVDGSQSLVKKGFPTFKSSKDTDEDIDLEVGDSDKENWLPGTQTSGVRRHRRGMSSQIRRPVLKNADMWNKSTVDDLALASGGRRGRASRTFRGSAHKANEANPRLELNNEVNAFTSGSGSSSRAEDLDCIQGLLSLSQGAWR